MTGIALRAPGHTVRLKWHRLRRQADDVPFAAARLTEGLALGASMEVDIRRHGGGGFVALHDATLDRETNGTGPIADAAPATLRRLRLRSGGGAPSPNAPILIEDLADLLAGSPPGALLQLDCKETADHLDAACLAAFAKAVAPCADRLILSGCDWTAVAQLGANVPGLSLGFDPCDLPLAGRLATPTALAEFVALTLATAPAAGTIYLAWPIVVDALALGVDLVAAFHAHGRLVDAWTLNPGHRNAAGILGALVGAKVDQITTDEPVAMAALWGEIGPE